MYGEPSSVPVAFVIVTPGVRPSKTTWIGPAIGDGVSFWTSTSPRYRFVNGMRRNGVLSVSVLAVTSSGMIWK